MFTDHSKRNLCDSLTHQTWVSRSGTPGLPERLWHSWPQPEQQQQPSAASSWLTTTAEEAKRCSVTCRKPHRLRLNSFTSALLADIFSVTTSDYACKFPLYRHFHPVSLNPFHLSYKLCRLCESQFLLCSDTTGRLYASVLFVWVLCSNNLPASVTTCLGRFEV